MEIAPMVNTSGVTVVGGARLDLFAQTSHFPRPGEIVLAQTLVTSPGGSGANQAATIGKLGGKVRLVAKVGGDPFGQELLRAMGTAGVDTGFAVMDPRYFTSLASVTLDDEGETTAVRAPGADAFLSSEEIEDALREAPPAILLVSLDLPGPTVVKTIAAAPSDTTVIVRAVAGGAPLEEGLDRVDYLIVNADQAEALTGIRPAEDAECLAAARRLMDRGVRNVVITLGEQGAFLATSSLGRHFSTLLVRPVDPTGAGDVFAGALARFLLERRPIEGAIYLANAAAAMSTLRVGTQPAIPTLRELREQVGELF